MDIPDEIKSKLKETPPEVIEYITLLHGIIGSMDARIKELESRLNLNSRNSGKPPSSDGYARKNRQNSQDANNLKKPGGQPGHKGKTLHHSPNPDHIQSHKPEFCHFFFCGKKSSGKFPQDVTKPGLNSSTQITVGSLLMNYSEQTDMKNFCHRLSQVSGKKSKHEETKGMKVQAKQAVH